MFYVNILTWVIVDVTSIVSTISPVLAVCSEHNPSTSLKYKVKIIENSDWLYWLRVWFVSHHVHCI